MKWGDDFELARYSGGAYGTGNLTAGDCGPECIVLHEVRWRLAANALLRKIFADRIEVLDCRNPYDSRPMPRLQIYAISTEESQAPSNTNPHTVRLFVAVRFDASATGVVNPGEPTVAALIAHIKQVLKAPNNFHLRTTVGGEDTHLAKRSQPGPTSWFADPDETGRIIAYHVEQAWDYFLNVNWMSGVIRNIEENL